jgi:hypothetical protein
MAPAIVAAEDRRSGGWGWSYPIRDRLCPPNERADSTEAWRSAANASAPEVVAHCGWPDHVNQTRTALGATEQWVYDSLPCSGYVYLVNGRLTMTQD